MDITLRESYPILHDDVRQLPSNNVIQGEKNIYSESNSCKDEEFPQILSLEEPDMPFDGGTLLGNTFDKFQINTPLLDL